MTVVIEHVRHRVKGLGVWPEPDPKNRMMGFTVCGKMFYPFGSKRDFAHHEPAQSRCGKCYE